MLNLIINNQKKSTIIIELCVIMLGWHINALETFFLDLILILMNCLLFTIRNACISGFSSQI